MSSLSRKVKLIAPIAAMALGISTVLVACGNEPDTNTVAKFLPANALGFVSVAIDPSTDQKANLFSMSRHLPEGVQAKDVDGVKDKLITDLLEDSDLDYEADVKPWLGAEAAVAVLPSPNATHIPIVVAALKTKDEKKTEDALKKAGLEANTYRFMDDYVFLVSKDQVAENEGAKALDAVASVVDDGADKLADAARYKGSLEALHGEHIVLGWVDTPGAVAEGRAAYEANKEEADSSIEDFGALGGLGSILGSGNSSDDATVDDTFDELQKAADKTGTSAFEVYIDDRQIVMESATEKAAPKEGDTSDRTIMNGLPGDTIFAFDTANTGKGLNALLDYIDKTAAESGNADSGVDNTAPSLRDLAGAIGNEGVLAVGSLAGLGENDIPDIGYVVDVRDEAAATAALKGLAGELGDLGIEATPITGIEGTGFSFTQAATPSQDPYADENFDSGAFYDDEPASNDFSPVAFNQSGASVERTQMDSGSGTAVVAMISKNRLIVSSSQEYATTLANGSGDLGTTGGVATAFGDENHALAFGLFVNAQAIVDYAVEQGAADDMSAEESAWTKSLDVVGAQSWSDDKHDYSEVRVAFK